MKRHVQDDEAKVPCNHNDVPEMGLASKTI